MCVFERMQPKNWHTRFPTKSKMDERIVIFEWITAEEFFPME